MLFVYGTLQDVDVLGAVLGRPPALAGRRRGFAQGYRAVHYPGRVYPALVAAAADTAVGLLLEDLSDLDMAVLDAFEGDEYRRHMITVRVDDVAVQAQAYLPVIAVSAESAVWSLAGWMANHKPGLLRRETGTALTLRQRLAAQLPD